MVSKKELENISENHPIILYDGDCILCSRSILWIIKNDKKDIFRFCSLQMVEGFNSNSDITTVILIENGKEYYKSDVTFKILENLGGLWKILVSLKLIPKFIRDGNL